MISLTKRTLDALRAVDTGLVRCEWSPTPLRRSTTEIYCVKAPHGYSVFTKRVFERLLRDGLVKRMNIRSEFGCGSCDIIISDKGAKALKEHTK